MRSSGDKYQRLNQTVRHGAVPGALPHVLPPRVYVAGRRRHGPVDQPDRPAAGAGPGLLPHPGDPVHLHVLHRPGPPHLGAGVHPQVRPREGHAAGACSSGSGRTSAPWWRRPSTEPAAPTSSATAPSACSGRSGPIARGTPPPPRPPSGPANPTPREPPPPPGTGRNPPAGRGRSGDSSYCASAPRCHWHLGAYVYGSCFSRARG